MLTIGSRRQVWNGTAKRTSGGLTKSDLIMSHGRIVSKSKHFSAKKEMRLLKYGYGTQKGKFGYVKLDSKKGKRGKRSRKMRGGMASLNPSGIGGNTIEGEIIGHGNMVGASVSDPYMLSGGSKFASIAAPVGGRSMGKSMGRGRSMGKSMGRGRSMGQSMRRGRSMRRGYGMAGGEEDMNNMDGGIIA
jgi:hypothetical protein